MGFSQMLRISAPASAVTICLIGSTVALVPSLSMNSRSKYIGPSPVLQSYRRIKRGRNVEEVVEDADMPIKRRRMERLSPGSSLYTDCYEVKHSESQTDLEIINCDTPTVSPVICLDDDTFIDNKENVSRVKQKSLSLKKYRPPAHCSRSPLKWKPKSRSPTSSPDDVEFVGVVHMRKNPSSQGGLFSSNISKKPLLRKLGTSPRSSRSETIVKMAFKKQHPLVTSTSAVYDLTGMKEYSQLLGSVLQSPELFKPVSPLRKQVSSDTIDLTGDELTVNRSKEPKTYRRSNMGIPKTTSVIDLTTPTHKSQRKSNFIDLINEKSVPKPRVVTPVNSLARKLRHEPCTSLDYLTKLEDEFREKKKEFEEDTAAVARTRLATLSSLNKLWQDALEERVRRHLRITDAIIDLEEEEEEEAKLPELTDDMLALVEDAWTRKPEQVLVNNFNYQIRRSDIATLHKLNWLNDEVINFYMQLIYERGKSEGFPSVYTFNTFFYPKLCKDGHPSLKRWTKKVDIFSHDIIIVPIHLQVHWCLASVHFKEKAVKYYDSMGHPNQKCLDLILKYLKDEMLDKKKQEFDLNNWNTYNVKDIPQQMNSCDCGVFACTFAEYLTRKASFNFTQNEMPYFRKKMAYEILSSHLLEW